MNNKTEQPYERLTLRLSIVTLITILSLAAPGESVAAVIMEKIFKITAYYSPLADQDFYIKGSFEADKKLNGNGTHGASGKPVFSGMVAAPSIYSFGTKIDLEGLGTVEVADRGGAIVKKGERNESYDRLDLWLGSGDEGLKKALSWGVRYLKGTVYDMDESGNKSVTLNIKSIPLAPANWNLLKKADVFSAQFQRGSEGENVKKLQELLTGLGYYQGTLSGVYDDATMDAVVSFQLDHKIIQSSGDGSAGYFGAKTAQALKARIASNTKPAAHKVTVLTVASAPVLNPKEATIEVATQINDSVRGKDGKTYIVPRSLTSEEDVASLSKALVSLGYVSAISKHAMSEDAMQQPLLSFQIMAGVIADKNAYGAGWYGPQTAKALKAALTRGASAAATASSSLAKQLSKTLAVMQGLRTHKVELIGHRSDPKPATLQKSAAPLTSSTKSAILSSASSLYLEQGMRGDKIKRLQKELTAQGYSTSVTGVFDTSTKQAVFRFQKDQALVWAWDSTGAGIAGPRTLGLLYQ